MLANRSHILVAIAGVLVGVVSTRILSGSRSAPDPNLAAQLAPASASPMPPAWAGPAPGWRDCRASAELANSHGESSLGEPTLPEQTVATPSQAEQEADSTAQDSDQLQAAWLRESIAEGLEVLRTAHPADRASRVMGAYVTGLAVVMDSGAHPCETMSPDDPRTRELERVRRQEQLQCFFHNGRTYYFKRGVFPEYDAWMDGYSSGKFTRSKNPRDLPDTGESMGGELEAALELRMLEAIALLGG